MKRRALYIDKGLGKTMGKNNGHPQNNLQKACPSNHGKNKWVPSKPSSTNNNILWSNE
jgi:hypothetical protein